VTTAAPITAEDAYSVYQQDPSKSNLFAVVKLLKPTTSYALAANQASDDPYLKGQADIVAAKAVQSWSPDSGASLASWTGTQMQRLARMRRENLMPVKIPDRAWQDNTALMRAERAFQEKHDRDPSLEELADEAGMPIKRITEVRRTARRIVPAAAFDTDAVGSVNPQDPTFDEATQYIYTEADKIDRAILEMRTGFGGKYEPMQANVIAQQLGIDPAQITRRSARLASRIMKIQRDIQRVHGGNDTSGL